MMPQELKLGKQEVAVTQTWDPDAYARDGAFVHGLASGVLERLGAEQGERILAAIAEAAKELGCDA